MFVVLVLSIKLPKENSKRLCGGIRARHLCLYQCSFIGAMQIVKSETVINRVID